ncbi:MAG: GNAT family N-acetyltransferase [Polyangiaceae bacterium]
MPDFELRLLSSIRDVPKASWDALLGRDASPFVCWEWLACLEEAGCVGEKSGWVPHHIGVYEGDVLVAAAPLYLKYNSEGEFVFDWSWADAAHQLGEDYYPKLVNAVPFTPAGGARVLFGARTDGDAITAAIASFLRDLTIREKISSTHSLFLRKEALEPWVASNFLERHGVQFQFENPGFEDFEAFLATLPSKRRTQIRRERSQPARDGMRIETVRELSPALVDAMYAFYLDTVDKFTYGRRYLNRAFFELVATRFSDKLAWVFAFSGNEPIAGAFNVQHEGVLYGRYWGAKAEVPFLHFNVCYYHGVSECISQGLHRFEPGAGGEHKRPRGFAPKTTYSAHYVRSARLRGLVKAFLDRERAHIARFVAENT